MRRLLIGDLRMRVRDEGDSGARAPVVMVHGAGASSVVWMDLVKRLAPARRVIAPDLPGHGQSDAWHETSIDLYRDAVGTMCAKLGVTKVVLVGHSMGAAVALACAAAWPERVTGLCLVGASERFPTDPAIVNVLDNDFEHAAQRLAPLQFSPATDGDLIARWTAVTIAASQQTTLADYRALDAWQAPPALAKLGMPVLLVTGSDDLLTPPRRAHELAARLANARVVIQQHTGHMCFLERPDEFNNLLDNFLREVA